MTQTPMSQTLAQTLEQARALTAQVEEIGHRLSEREAQRQQLRERLDRLQEGEPGARGGLLGALRRGGEHQAEVRETLRLVSDADHEIQVLVRDRKALLIKAHAAAEQVGQARLRLIEAELETIKAMPEWARLMERLRLVQACYKQMLRKTNRQPPPHWMEALLSARPTQDDLAAAAALLQLEES